MPEVVLGHISLISVFTFSSLAIEVFLLLLTVLDFQMRDKVHNTSYHFKTPRCCSCSSSGYMWRLKISTCTAMDFLSAKNRHVQIVLMFKYLCSVSMSPIMSRSAYSWISLRPQASQKHNRLVQQDWKVTKTFSGRTRQEVGRSLDCLCYCYYSRLPIHPNQLLTDLGAVRGKHNIELSLREWILRLRYRSFQMMLLHFTLQNLANKLWSTPVSVQCAVYSIHVLRLLVNVFVWWFGCIYWRLVCFTGKTTIVGK